MGTSPTRSRHFGRTRTGEETISDLAYLNHGYSVRSSEPYFHEKRMLDDWFKSTFVERPR